MRIEQMKLENFRQVRVVAIDLAPGANLFFGENAQGKTTILEAVHYLSTGRSFRTAKDKDILPQWHADGSELPEYAAAESVFLSHDTRHKLRIALTRSSKSVWADEKPLPTLGELWGLMNVVVFLPGDTELVTGTPTARRTLLGSLLARASRFDLFTMQRYANALRQRNALFRSPHLVRPAEFDVQEELMAEHGVRLMVARQRLVAELSPMVRRIVHRLTDTADDLEMHHESGWPKSAGIEERHLQDTPEALAELKEQLRDLWHDSRKTDKERGHTEHGPHKADLGLVVNHQDARSFASQGQARTIVLALRLAEMELLKKSCGEHPIMLFDDVLGELDHRRSREFIRLIAESGAQSLLTATDATTLEDILPIRAKFSVKSGQVVRIR